MHDRRRKQRLPVIPAWPTSPEKWHVPQPRKLLRHSHAATTVEAMFKAAMQILVVQGSQRTSARRTLATFANPNGLVNPGNNAYAQTSESGVAQISTPGSTNHGVLQGGETEDSNVDLTLELVELITAQRNYQANAQTIKTQQTVDQTLINM